MRNSSSKFGLRANHQCEGFPIQICCLFGDAVRAENIIQIVLSLPCSGLGEPGCSAGTGAADGEALGCGFTWVLVCLMPLGQINPFYFLHLQSASTDLGSEVFNALIFLQTFAATTEKCAKADFSLFSSSLLVLGWNLKNYLMWFRFYFPMEACASFIPTGAELCLLEISTLHSLQLHKEKKKYLTSKQQEEVAF